MARSIEGGAIDTVLQEAVSSGAVPHVVAIAADRDGVIYEGAAGPRVVGADDPVGPSTRFRIMSMTKMVCTATALQQVERGALDLDAPVDTYRPEFADIAVLDGFDGDAPRLRAPRSRATVRHLITHTTGLAYWFWSTEILRYEQVTGVPNVVAGTLDALRAPMTADPGTRFVYGINTDWLGLVVEAVAGKTLDVVVKEDITEPLGMGDTSFRLDQSHLDDLAALHLRDADGNWGAVPNAVRPDPQWWPGGHGLHSTPRDYIRFERALLRGGELDGERILSRETVDAAFTHQIGDLDFPAEIRTAEPSTTDSLRVGPGFTWGYGLLLNTRDAPGGRRAGTGAWAGLYNTHFFIDRATGVCASIYTNALPFLEAGAWTMYGDFEQALYAAL